MDPQVTSDYWLKSMPVIAQSITLFNRVSLDLAK